MKKRVISAVACGLSLSAAIVCFNIRGSWADETTYIGYGSEQIGFNKPVVVYQFEEPYEYVPFTWDVTPCEETMYSNTSLNVRSEPRADAQGVGSYTVKDTVSVTGKVTGSDWVQVKYGEIEAYVNSHYLVDKQIVVPTEGPVLSPDNRGSEAVADSVYPLVADGSVTAAYMKQCFNYWNTMPENVKNRYISDGWSLIISSNNFASNYGYSYSGILALTVYGSPGTTYISTRSGASASIVHEIGHYIDYTSGWASLTDDFASIWNEELGTFINCFPTHHSNYDTSMEYFAESYQNCILQGNKMQQNCPKTYEYVMGISNSL